MGSFPPVSPPRTYTPPSPHPYAPHALPISFFSILSPSQYWVSSTNHLAPRYAISSVTSSLLGPNILLNTMFSNTLSFLSTGNVNDQISHLYKLYLETSFRLAPGCHGRSPSPFRTYAAYLQFFCLIKAFILNCA